MPVILKGVLVVALMIVELSAAQQTESQMLPKALLKET